MKSVSGGDSAFWAPVNWACDEHGDTPLAAATVAGHRVIATFLLEQRADINAKLTKTYIDIPEGSTPLDVARIMGHRAIATMLEDHHASSACQMPSFEVHASRPG